MARFTIVNEHYFPTYSYVVFPEISVRSNELLIKFSITCVNIINIYIIQTLFVNILLKIMSQRIISPYDKII